MNITSSGIFTAFFLSLFPLSVVAQDSPSVEVFGGYSHLHVPEQSATQLKSAGLNGWAASLKLNVTPRIGLVVDFGGNYGQRGSEPYLLRSSSGDKLVGLIPGDLGQHTFLVGPEARVLRRGRLSVNVRALVGVARTNSLTLLFREPVERSGGSPPFTRASVPGGNAFAASLGGSVDYRITNRWAFRIIQPELLVNRYNSISTGFNFATSVNTYSLRLSSGIVFTSGGSSSAVHTQNHRRLFSFGLIGGAGLTDAFGHDTTGYFPGLNGVIEAHSSRSYSTLKDYVIGPAINIGLPWRDVSLEMDALYRPLNLTEAGVLQDGSLSGVSPATVVTWELPVLLKYTLRSGTLSPFIEAGPSFRTSGNLNAAQPSSYGGTAGLGVEANLWRLRIGPVVRYTHWAADLEDAGSPTKKNQIELLFGVVF